MYLPPEYPDFYVAVLTVVPILFAGVLIFVGRAGEEMGALAPRGKRLARDFLLGINAVIAAFWMIMALLILAGMMKETDVLRGTMAFGTSVQIVVGVSGVVIEFRSRPRGK